MTKKLALLALLAACAANGAIKKAQDIKPAPPAEKPAEKPAAKADTRPAATTLAEALKRLAQESKGKLKVGPKELGDIFRKELQRLGVPADKMKGASPDKLAELVKEKNPDFFKGMPGTTVPMDKATERKLAEHFGELLEGHRPGAAAAAPATFRLRDGKNAATPLAFATGVQADGWLLTKASEVKDIADLQCEVGGKWLAAKVTRTWADHDLALLKVAATELPTVAWSDNDDPDVGTFITAVAPEGRDPVAIGVVSVATRSGQTKGRGFLGVQLATDEKGLKVRELVPGGPAKASGLQREDRILEIDGKKPESVFTFTKLVSDRKAGDKVRLKLQRGEEVMEKEIALGDRAAIPGASGGRGNARFDRMNSMGSTVSKRRTDFAAMLQTDLPLEATQCGGPVTDLDGNVIGIVIARSGRVETMVVPSETIRTALGELDFAKEAAK